MPAGDRIDESVFNHIANACLVLEQARDILGAYVQFLIVVESSTTAGGHFSFAKGTHDLLCEACNRTAALKDRLLNRK